MPEKSQDSVISLPAPDTESQTSLEHCLQNRRSRRQYSKEALRLKQAAQLLWAAQGITSSRGLRTAPSAGALYPLEIYLVASKVENLEPGLYHYRPADHELACRKFGNYREALCRAGLSQSAIREAPAAIVITGVVERTTAKYGRRGVSYVYMEAGHAAQNALLQAVSLDLAGVPIGAFQNRELSRLMELAEGEEPLYILCIGHPAGN